MKKHDEKFDKKEKDLENALRRALADYQNLEKRIAEEKSSWVRSANKDLILRLLPVLDDLYLANKHLQNEGLRLGIQKFHGVLAQEGLEDFHSVGMKFDPNIMEALGVREGEEGKILEEVRPGYKLNGKI